MLHLPHAFTSYVKICFSVFFSFVRLMSMSKFSKEKSHFVLKELLWTTLLKHTCCVTILPEYLSFKNEFKGWTRKVTPKATLWCACHSTRCGPGECWLPSAMRRVHPPKSAILWTIKETSYLAHACPRLCQSSLSQAFSSFSLSAKLQSKSFLFSVGLNHMPGSTDNLCPLHCCPTHFAIFTSSPELHSLKGNLYLTSEVCQNLTPHLSCLLRCYISWLLP